MRSVLATITLLSLVAACSDASDADRTPSEPNPVDAGDGDATGTDTGLPSDDAGARDTEGPPPTDAGPSDDARDDAADGLDDTGTPDGGPQDGGPSDDGGENDGGDTTDPDGTPSDVIEADTGDDVAPDTTDPDTDDGSTVAPGRVPEPFTVTDGTRGDGVLLTWGAVDDAVGYRVLRDEAPLEIVAATTTEYLDTTARTSPLPGAVSGLSLASESGGLRLSWTPVPPTPAPIHEYRVVALFEAEDGPPSVRRIGRRAPASIRYEVQIGGSGPWTSAGATASYLDTAATAGSFQLGAPIVGKAASTAGVPLDVEQIRLLDGPLRQYRVRAVSDAGNGEASAQLQGARRLTEDQLTFQWTRFTSSTGSGPSSPAALRARSVVDTSAPANGDAAWYRLRVTGPGSVERTTPIVEGFRAWDCVDDTSFVGAMGPNNTQEPLTTGSGIAAVHTWVQGESIPWNEGRPVGPVLEVRNATVTAINRFPRENFWVQDATSALRVRLSTPLLADVRVGQRVSFEVTAVSNITGHIYATAVRNFRVESSDHPVPWIAMSGQPGSSELRDQIVRVAGRLEGPATSCGGTANCWPLQSGARNLPMQIEYRSTSSRIAAGQCITWVGPWSEFPGPYPNTTNPAPQLDSQDWSWTQIAE